MTNCASVMSRTSSCRMCHVITWRSFTPVSGMPDWEHPMLA